MSPSHSRHSPPALSDDDLVAVFLRIPPDDPAGLVRASLVCKAWRRILTSPDFCRLYREFHGTPPILGVVVSYWSPDMDHVCRLIPTTGFRSSEDLGFAPHRWSAVDSRHGRILVQSGRDDELSPRYIVCDPITSGRWGVPPVPRIDGLAWTAAVLCAKENCDHLGCHGHPFLVAMVVSSPGTTTTSACVYSSESGVWSDIITVNHGKWDQIDSDGRSILVGNTLHFPFIQSYNVLQYKLGEQKLSVIDVPEVDWKESLVFISAEDDVLVFAGWRGTKLSLWSTKAGALAWTECKVIDLEKLLPPRAFDNKCDGDDDYAPYVSAFAEGAVFLSTMAGLFTVELNSGRTKKVADVEMAFNVTPWTSFYTLDHARRMRPPP